MTRVIPCSCNPLRLMKACLYCAWVAAHHIHERQTSANQEHMELLWEELCKSQDAPCSAQMKEGWLYADTIQGCKIRLSMRQSPDTNAVEFQVRELTEKYQPWSTTYPTIESLVRAANELITGLPNPEQEKIVSGLMKVVQLSDLPSHPAFSS